MNLRIIPKIAEAFIFLMYCGLRHLSFSNSWQRIPRIIYYYNSNRTTLEVHLSVWCVWSRYIERFLDLNCNSPLAPDDKLVDFGGQYFFSRNPLDPQIEVIKFRRDEAYSLQNAMLHMGFTRTRIGLYDILQPCSLGTFSKGNGKCTECPPGLF